MIELVESRVLTEMDGMDSNVLSTCDAMLYNPVALPYAFPPAFSTPTTCLCALVFVGSGVQVRSGFWGSIVSSSRVCSGGGALGTLSMGR